jgi:hypothetical protein
MPVTAKDNWRLSGRFLKKKILRLGVYILHFIYTPGKVIAGNIL